MQRCVDEVTDRVTWRAAQVTRSVTNSGNGTPLFVAGPCERRHSPGDRRPLAL